MTPPVHKNTAAKKPSFKASLTQEERMRLADIKEEKKAMQKEHKQAKIEATKQRRFSKLEKQNEAIKRRSTESGAKEDPNRNESDSDEHHHEQQKKTATTTVEQEPATTTNPDLIETDIDE